MLNNILGVFRYYIQETIKYCNPKNQPEHLIQVASQKHWLTLPNA